MKNPGSEQHGGLSETEYKLLDTFADKNVQNAEPSELMAELPAPIQRGGVYLITGVLFATLLLLYAGKVHVVVTAKGRIIPEGDVRIVQVLQGGIVNTVLAHVGDRLPAGAPIARIDVSESGVDLALEKKKFDLDSAQLHTWQITLAAANQLLANPQTTVEKNQGAMSADIANFFNGVENAALKLEIASQDLGRLPEQKQVQSREIDLLKEHIDLLEKNHISQAAFLEARAKGLQDRKTQLDGMRRLAQNRLISPVELNGEEEKYRIAESEVTTSRQAYDQQAIDVSNQKLRLAELTNKLKSTDTDSQNAFRQARVNYDQSLAALRRQRDDLQIKIRELEPAMEANQRKIKLAESRMSQATVSMPVAGTIAELKIHHSGELISAGAAAVTIIPAGVPLMVEAEVANKDIGFVRVGLEAQVKVDAYPFGQFGAAAAKVVTVVPGAGGGNFIVTLRLLQDTLDGNGTTAGLFPGLTVKAELLTSKQRLLDLLLTSGSKDKDKQKDDKE